jgi:hypothetical protein
MSGRTECSRPSCARTGTPCRPACPNGCTDSPYWTTRPPMPPCYGGGGRCSRTSSTWTTASPRWSCALVPLHLRHRLRRGMARRDRDRGAGPIRAARSHPPAAARVSRVRVDADLRVRPARTAARRSCGIYGGGGGPTPTSRAQNSRSQRVRRQGLEPRTRGLREGCTACPDLSQTHWTGLGAVSSVIRAPERHSFIDRAIDR